ncbi:somatotropin [Limosa lapponica baueri]|uniref:Somatotropin n=1 Tax=Limosa lapponica baueri TaxID=1758121 RepID=A0A2I0T560_LIMLA|nr:somatotropin [Limosa lapponica baueri]
MLLFLDKGEEKESPEEDHTYEGLEVEQMATYEDITPFRDMKAKWTVGEHPAMPLSNLFANAVLRAQHLHLLAAETYKEFERTYIPEDQRHANKNSQAAFCYSETIPAPTGKDDAQQKSDV